MLRDVDPTSTSEGFHVLVLSQNEWRPGEEKSSVSMLTFSVVQQLCFRRSIERQVQESAAHDLGSLMDLEALIEDHNTILPTVDNHTDLDPVLWLSNSG
jgi:hypothetical protein